MSVPISASSRRLVRKLLGISALSVLSITGRNVNASELFSESVYVPPVTDPVAFAAAAPTDVWKRFHILLADQPNLPTQNVSDPNTDPFAVNGSSTITVTYPYAFPVAASGDWVGPGPVTLGGLTAVNFTGTTAINAGSIPNQGLSNPSGQVQFGLTGPIDNTPMRFVGQHWGYEPVAAGPFFRAVPIVSIIPSVVAPATPPAATSFNYIVDFIQFTEDGISGTEWAEFPYVPGNQPTFTYGGWADPLDPIHFTNSQIQLSPTLILLDDLNFADDPLSGGSSGPAFEAAAIPADVVPEPSTFVLSGMGVLGLLARRRNRAGRK
jgi:hypothetical protein